MENAPDGIYMNDFEGNFLYGNRRCEEIIGYKREELLGKNFLELNILPEDSLAKAAEILQDNINGKSTGPDELALIRKDGRRVPIEINTSLVHRVGEKVVLAFVRDITERKQAEEALRESEVRFRELFNRMSSGVAVFERR
jgi:PAS domain S-box-containing protein